MSTEDLLGLAIPVAFFFMLAVELFRPARQFPRVKLWRLVGVVFLVVVMAVNIALPLVLPIEWMQRHRLFDGTRLGTVGGVIAGYLVTSLLGYLWHRAEHRFHFLWRWFHQMHHSPTRMDLSGVFFFHPFDVVSQIVWSFVAGVLILGLTPLAAALTGTVAAFYALFQHWNIATPRWLGFLIQRPESHCLHHERDVHARNYSDLPLWDMLFGSFHNPATFAGEVGFAPAEARRVGAMLLGRDVTAPPLS